MEIAKTTQKTLKVPQKRGFFVISKEEKEELLKEAVREGQEEQKKLDAMYQKNFGGSLVSN